MTALPVALFLLLAAVFGLLALIASAPPPNPRPTDVFGFACMGDHDAAPLAPVERFIARDGEPLAVRVYPSHSPITLIFLHGSSWHGVGYHLLAHRLAEKGVAQVVLPNLRGHYLSGPRRGDCDYQEQLEDDIADLIGWLRQRGTAGKIYLGGHSSGGGLAIRFAGGKHRSLVDGLLMLAPILPTSPAMRGGNAGGWASVHLKRLIGLLIANRLGVTGLDALPVIAFNKPAEFRDGSETLSYSHRLNAAYHPRPNAKRDLHWVGVSSHVLVGDLDQAIDAEKLRALFVKHAQGADVEILPGIDHFGIFTQAEALARIEEWLAAITSQVAV